MSAGIYFHDLKVNKKKIPSDFVIKSYNHKCMGHLKRLNKKVNCLQAEHQLITSSPYSPPPPPPKKKKILEKNPIYIYIYNNIIIIHKTDILRLNNNNQTK